MFVKLYLHPPLERIWHGVHTLCILILILTGATLRFPEAIPLLSIGDAVLIHNLFGQILVVDFLLWIPYLLLTGRITHYLPTQRDLLTGIVNQALYYGLGIFKGEHHPYSATERQKFNPLQKWAYIGVMFGLVPLLILTGIGLMSPTLTEEFFHGRLHVLAVIHRILSYCSVAFLISHVYLATTGYTVGDAFVSMVTGFAKEGVHDEEEKE